MSTETQTKEPEQATISEMAEALVHGLVRRLYELLSVDPHYFNLPEIEAMSAALTAIMEVHNRYV